MEAMGIVKREGGRSRRTATAPRAPDDEEDDDEPFEVSSSSIYCGFPLT